MNSKWEKIYYTLEKEYKLLPENTKITSERDLCLRFDVNRSTIRKAINRLIDEKILIRYEKRGTFISNSKSEKLHSESELINDLTSTINNFEFVNYIRLGKSLKYKKKRYIGNKLISLEEVLVSRSILPAQWKDRYQNEINKSLLKFIESYDLTKIAYSKKDVSTFSANNKDFVLVKSDVYNEYDELIIVSTLIYTFEEFKISFTEYRN